MGVGKTNSLWYNTIMVGYKTKPTNYLQTLLEATTMAQYTGTEKQNQLLDTLIQCCYEDKNFMENRLIELIEFSEDTLAETYL
jgi:hypothetical protein